MKIILLVAIILIGFCEPSFALYSAEQHPRYMYDLKVIEQDSCNAIAIIPYSGRVLYNCPNGVEFWSEVLTPSANSPLFMYFKNRKHQSDQDAESSAYVTTFGY